MIHVSFYFVGRVIGQIVIDASQKIASIYLWISFQVKFDFFVLL